MMTFTYPNTETLAELAWRYGEQEFQRQPDPYSHNTFIFWDSSAITRWRVHTPRPWRRRREIMDATAAAILGGWETTR